MNKSFWQSGHTPTLLASFFYFDLSFMVWYLLGPLAVLMATDLSLTAQERGLMVATPTLAGALLRIVFGVLVDKIGPKRSGLIAQVIVIAALAAAWLIGVNSFEQALLLGLFLGVAGAAFAIALPLASRWYPPEHQGTALGIAGAGNSGTVFAALFAPALALAYGWQNVFGLALIPLCVAFVVFLVAAKDAPDAPAPKTFAQYLAVLSDPDAWWFMLFYCLTFGGFIGLASSLPGYFHDQFGMGPVHAGYATAACVLAGSMMRPMGGVLADRIGGIKSLLSVYGIAALAIVGASMAGGAASTIALFIVAMLALGAGNGSVFQLVPQRFAREIGVMTGVIGMAGGVGGFLLAAGLGVVKQHTGDYRMGLVLFAALLLSGWIGLSKVKSRWRTTWGSSELTSARV
ncbi:nitrate/nitrite transporter [Crenobacter cavernae]|uniref:NarK/NasA family nitrate transporter n=1 Tax=Crenobacter cavernae TaxID=2290923 RepID=A0A345Y2M7_9NEIS|nr:nitrate/nitrite transporter [Crenobacter cavernae]AXK38179.1 NarK/NasA family nitrate transporter [Crenobacter cavernae]